MFKEVKKNFGFGCMRLPMNNEEVDLVEFTKMVDYFMENGFNYFDTAHGYLNEKSENIYMSWLVHMCANFAINLIGMFLLNNM